MEVVTLSLISHTNVGKTTLARTLLRRDVGQVIDQAHVTEANEVFDLVAVEGGHRGDRLDQPALHGAYQPGSAGVEDGDGALAHPRVQAGLRARQPLVAQVRQQPLERAGGAVDEPGRQTAAEDGDP